MENFAFIKEKTACFIDMKFQTMNIYTLWLLMHLIIPKMTWKFSSQAVIQKWSLYKYATSLTFQKKLNNGASKQPWFF